MKIDLGNFDLTQLPSAEDDNFEFKSSRTCLGDLKKKLSCAVSAFANSGGGCFIAGVDSHGNADNGLHLKDFGRQDLRDWADQIVNQVEPVPKYEIKIISDSVGRGVIQSDSAVLLVAVYESHAGPHMAHDNCYYIRAGAHTVKAKHFIVDAIWAKRHFSKPRLTHLFRLKPEKEQAIQLGILSLTDAPAIEVKVNISPLPKMMSNLGNLFPLQISVIDQDNPFFFDVATHSQADKLFGENVLLEVEYKDLSGHSYNYNTRLGISGSVPPVTLTINDASAKIVTALESINKALLKLAVPHKNIAKPSFLLPQPSESVFLNIESLIPELLADMRSDLQNCPFARQFIIMNKGVMYCEDTNNFTLKYYFEDHAYLRNKLRILENQALVYEITYNDAPRFVISEELAAYLRKPQTD